MTLANPSDRPAEGVLAAEVLANLDTVFGLAPTRVELEPGSRRAITMTWDYPGTTVYEGYDGRSVSVPGPRWGLTLNVAWRDRDGRERDRGHLVFGIDRGDAESARLAELSKLNGPGRDFAIRHSGYLANPAIQESGVPADFGLRLTNGAVEHWKRGAGPSGSDTCLAFLRPCPDSAAAVVEHATGNARLLRAWLLEPDRNNGPRAARLNHLSDLKTFRFRIPPLPAGGVLVLEFGASHHVPAVSLESLAKGAEAKFGIYPDPLLGPAGTPIRTPDQWALRQPRMSQAIREALGLDREPPPCPLDPKLVSEETVLPRSSPTGWSGSYLRRKVSIQVRPGERNNVWLLIPPGLGPFPAVLACHQTVSEGKDEPIGLGGNVWQLDFGPSLVSRGLVVAAVDCPTFGERLDALTETPQDTAKFEASDPAWSLLGRGFQDHARALDYLASLPIVAADRFGVIGHSLGGESAAILTALDPRIRCAVISCGFTLLRTLEKASETYCSKGHAILPPRLGASLEVPVGERKLPFDFDDMMKLWVPRPVFYHEVRDELPQFTSAPQTLQAALALRRIYQLHHAEECYYPIVSAQAHCFPRWVQADAFDWLTYWLEK